eukprot:473702-Rhodomonas_salina.1
MPYRWTEGRHIPSTAKLSLLTDTQLARALAHHRLQLPLASSYWIWDNKYTASEVVITKAKQSKGTALVEVDVMKPTAAKQEGVFYDLPISN